MSWRQATDLAGMNVYDNGLASRAEAQRWEAQIREGEPISFGPYTWTISREGSYGGRSPGGNERRRGKDQPLEERPFVRRGLVETPSQRADRQEREAEEAWRRSLLEDRWNYGAGTAHYRRKGGGGGLLRHATMAQRRRGLR